MEEEDAVAVSLSAPEATLASEAIVLPVVSRV
jgi:hypothetical protein